MTRLRRLAQTAALALACLALSPAARAQCQGSNLIAALPAAERQALRAAADAAPFARGNLWQARRDGQVIHLVGTYHLDDPRHAAMMDRITPLIASASTVLVEAGPEEEAALKDRMARDPSVMVNTDGPTLREALTDPEWQALAAAMRDRGLPPFLVSKFRPWYVSALLAVPACQMAASEAAAKLGLDGRIIAQASRSGVPVRALEPYDTVFRLFDAMPAKDQLAMVRSALATESRAADYAVTLAEAYFAEDARLIWELTRKLSADTPGYTAEQIEADLARMEQDLMVNRNRAWIPVIEEAAAQGPILVAFGALHLSGEAGVLNLLAQAGYTLTRL